MLRIYFSSEDLGRIRVLAAPDHLWEAVCAVQLLHSRDGPLIFDEWRREVRRSALRPPFNAVVRTFGRLAPHAPYFPDFLTPVGPFDDIEAGINAVLRTPREQLHAEMSLLDDQQRLPGWARGIATGDPEVLHRLGAVILQFHHVVTQPYLSQVRAALNAEYAQRADLAGRRGAEKLLNSFAPLMHWNPPVLSARYPIDKTIRLNGRGLLLIPSFFCWRDPIALADPDLTPTLVYPVDHVPGWTQPDSGRRSGLAALIGSTRAAVLGAMAGGCTTSDAARLTGISAATATHHANVLRDAHLITSRRDAGTVVHTTTPLGMELLNSSRTQSDL